MRLTLLPIVALVTACNHPSTTQSAAGRIDAKARAIDEDTFAVDVRLLGADAFERDQLCRTRAGCWPYDEASQDFASRMPKRGEATIRLTGKQSYGRPIGTVEVAGRDLGEELIAAGLTVPVIDFLASDPARAIRYEAALHSAASAHAGAQAGLYLHPAEWRHGARLSCEAGASDDEHRDYQAR